jgi:hypothetical protein
LRTELRVTRERHSILAGGAALAITGVASTSYRMHKKKKGVEKVRRLKEVRIERHTLGVTDQCEVEEEAVLIWTRVVEAGAIAMTIAGRIKVLDLDELRFHAFVRPEMYLPARCFVEREAWCDTAWRSAIAAVEVAANEQLRLACVDVIVDAVAIRLGNASLALTTRHRSIVIVVKDDRVSDVLRML